MIVEWVFGGAFLSLIAGFSAHLVGRLKELEAQLEAYRGENRELWSYTRRLIDLYYRYRRDDSPDVPKLDIYD